MSIVQIVTTVQNCGSAEPLSVEPRSSWCNKMLPELCPNRRSTMKSVQLYQDLIIVGAAWPKSCCILPGITQMYKIFFETLLKKALLMKPVSIFAYNRQCENSLSDLLTPAKCVLTRLC